MLATGELLNFARTEQIHTLLMQWSRKLEEIEAVLADAEEKQIIERGINLWLADLEDLAYDLDDVLDEFSTEALQRKVMAEPGASTRKVRALLPTCCASFNPRTLMSDFRMRSKIDDITTRLQDIFERRKGLGLQKVGSRTSAKAWKRPHTTSLIYEPHVYGRDKDENGIIELLLGDESGDNKVGVVPIVGMGGVGKTTLAQMVYNNGAVKKHFDLKAWVCVSDEFDIMRVTKEIFESVTSGTCEYSSLDQLQVQLKQAMSGKRFLLVLDDVWNKSHRDWSSLKSPFNDGAQGSKVIVTTRNTDVALMMGTGAYHYLKQLSEDDCWSVFAQHAFGNTSINASPNLVSIGRKIVEKCGGLPLAARTLGGLLRCKLRDDEWEDVLNSKIWELSDKESDIFPALRLSYYHLPSQLKKCFAYCSILPKDYEFEEEELVLLWMAEGFIQQPIGKKQMEDLGREYFHELLSRSFFQPSSTGKTSKFMMHDLINDLAQFVAKETCFRLEDMLKDNRQYKNINKARHSSYARGYFDGIKKFELFYDAKHLRTFLPCDMSGRNCYLTSSVPLDLLPNLRCIRVFSSRGYQICELPSSIGDLKHLRYLNLSNAMLSSLPESLANLYNLQTLILSYCKFLKKLSTNMGNLINLRHLDITGANSLQEMPPKMGNLTSLQTLSNFIVSKGNGFTIRELGNLIHLRGRLCISGLEYVVEALDARGASLNNKRGLHVLSLEWRNGSNDKHNGRNELAVLDMLQPHENLKELTIICYPGPRFPTWVGDPMFSKMVCLQLENCEKCTFLPPLGWLSSLTRLHIEGMKSVKKVGLEFYGWSCSNPFPSLETLCIWDMPEWEDWSPPGVEKEVQAFSRLSMLSIQSCPKLFGKLPSNLPCLRNLEIRKCPQLVHQMTNTIHFNSLTKLHLNNVSILDSLCTDVADEVVLGTEVGNHLGSLTSMHVGCIQKITSLPRCFFQEVKGLQRLTINNCEQLATLWPNEATLQHHLPALGCLVIQSCPQLHSLFEKEEKENEGKLQQQHKVLPFRMRLEHLQIRNCGKLEKLPLGMQTFTSLQELTIEECPCLISFPSTDFPTTLRTLEIIKCLVSFQNRVLPSALRTLRVECCDDLQSLPELKMHNNLEKLEVRSCPSLTYLWSSNGILPSLKELMISSCGMLESLLSDEGMKISCSSLESITIYGCKNLKSLPDVMQNNSLRNLRELDIRTCDNLESLPEGWCPTTNMKDLNIFKCKKIEALLHQTHNNNFTSLQQQEVRSCPAGIASYFPNLTSLDIGKIEISKPPSEWGLYRLFSLRELSLEDFDWVSFPEDGMLLPSSLIKLFIVSFPNLDKLSSKEFQNLTSLEELSVFDCPMLTSFPEQGLPPSLLHLEINECPSLTSFPVQGLPPSLLHLKIFKCPNLTSFPVQGIPPSLLHLEINNCPVLKQRCERRKGQYWPFIANIPCVLLDNKSIFSTSS
ncbi:putative disease resistance RPP13-like protein 1 [Actinidia eriantha]|uniref:putative disease resistance RPP13-like protein 1 n=1 Tax=Actinidia eriantha TaxID=165200 RepID=UPI0025828148|nr:putative disease resistance RPP13-like protein 1 [Actinidia eriantha]